MPPYGTFDMLQFLVLLLKIFHYCILLSGCVMVSLLSRHRGRGRACGGSIRGGGGGGEGGGGEQLWVLLGKPNARMG